MARRQVDRAYFEAYNPNVSYSAAEDSDTTGTIHTDALDRSWMKIESDGDWQDTADSISGTVKHIELLPARAVLGNVTLSRDLAITRKALSMVVSQNTQIQSLTNGKGKSVDLNADSSQVSIVPSMNGVATARSAAKSGQDIGELVLQSPAATATLSGAQRLHQRRCGTATTPTRNSPPAKVNSARALTRRPTPYASHRNQGRRHLRPATLTIVDSVDRGKVERVLTVSGPPHMSASTGTSAQVTASGTGSYTVTLSTIGKGVIGQTVPLGAIPLAVDRP